MCATYLLLYARVAAYLASRRGSRDSQCSNLSNVSNEEVGPLNFNAHPRGRQRRTSNFLELPGKNVSISSIPLGGDVSFFFISWGERVVERARRGIEGRETTPWIESIESIRCLVCSECSKTSTIRFLQLGGPSNVQSVIKRER